MLKFVWHDKDLFRLKRQYNTGTSVACILLQYSFAGHKHNYFQTFNHLQNLPHDVAIVEPKEIPGSDGTMDTYCLLSLVSYAMNLSTEGPITVVSK